MQPETLFKEKVVQALKALPHTWFVKTQERTVRGIPDLLICCRGLFVALELKIPPNTLDPLQDYHLKRIKRAGGLALEVTPETWANVLHLLIDVATGKRVLMPEPGDQDRIYPGH